MTLRLVLNNYTWPRYDFGRNITFRLYEEDKKTVYDASATGETGSALTPIIKIFKRHGDRAFFFRDIAKHLSVIGQVAQVIEDITGSWSTQNQGIGTFAFTKTKRPTVPGYHWTEVQLVDNVDESLRTVQISSELVRAYVPPSEAA